MAHSEMGEPVLGKPSERVDNRDAGDGYFCFRERVEKWAKDRVAERLPMQVTGSVCAPSVNLSFRLTPYRKRIIPARIGGRT
jgi:hypothetical protein